MTFEEVRHELDELGAPTLISKLLEARDGAAQLAVELPKQFSSAESSQPGNPQNVWQLCGRWYMQEGRWHEAISVFHGLYEQMLQNQIDTNKWVHKGLPLVWLSECYYRLGCPVLSKRYIMLTTCEDAIQDGGKVRPERGVYFRLVWRHGMGDVDVSRYGKEMFALHQKDPQEGMFPEWILQRLDQDWIIDFPSPKEAALYVVNTMYVLRMLKQLGAGDGQALEFLGHYILSAIPGCRANRRLVSEVTDYDIVCTLEGQDLDFRSDLGRYFICECKDWASRADFTAFAKFCRVLDSAKCRFGILFSRMGISGAGKARYAAREQLKVFQDRGLIIIVLTESDLSEVAGGANLISMLRAKYEGVRLDLRDPQSAREAIG